MEDIDLDLEALTRGVHASVPMMRAMGLRVIELSRGHAVAEIPLEPNVNHYGAVYAGAMLTVAEVLGPLIAFVSFDLDGYYPDVKRVEVDLHRTVKGPVRAETTLSDEELERVEAEARATGRAEFALEVQLTDEQQRSVATVSWCYVVRRFPTPR